MPSDKKQVWVDSTFIPGKVATKDTHTNIQFADAENIGSYSMPVIYSQEEPEVASIDTWAQYFNELTSISGVEDTPVGYFSYITPLKYGVEVSLVEFFGGEKDKIFEKDINTIYTTGFNSVSGSLNRIVVFTGGKELQEIEDTAAFYRTYPSSSGIMEWITNYTNFSGDLTVSGSFPIPCYDNNLSYDSVYGADYTITQGVLNRIVDISFAGWVPFVINTDIYSALLGFKKGYDSEVTVISGSVDIHYTEVICASQTTSGINTDLYCALIDLAYIGGEVETIKGRIGYIETDIYSTIEDSISIKLEIDLLSLKISNFSLEEGEFTTASGFISVDITDDECPISTINSYFEVDGVRVPVVFSVIDDGYRMYYDPLDDFSSIEGPTTFMVHAENECGKVLERNYYLTFGYIVELKNNSSTGIDYGFNNKVAVRVTAENYASCPQVSSLAWDFRSVELKNRDLGASIVGKFHALENESLPAQIYPHSTAYFYGKEFRVVVKAKDFAGNEMEPLVLSYRIMDKPEN